MAMTIILTGGGSAGHVTPNLALLGLLRQRGYGVEYIGSYDGIERQLATGAGLPYHGIATGKFRRYFDIKNITDPFRVLKGCRQAKKILADIRPAAVFSKGGFVSVPVAMAAHSLKIPLILHESDMTPGLANRICMRYARQVCTSFPEAAQALGDKGIYTGAPLRAELFTGSKTQGLKLCGFDTSRPVVMVAGGSLGAQAINDAVRQALDKLTPRFQVVHLCGKGKADPEFANREGYRQIEYADDEMRHLLAAADMMISRAGSNAICEFLALKKPMLLIPLPAASSRGDQILNAQSFQSRGFAQVLPQENLTAQSLLGAVISAWALRHDMTGAMDAIPRDDAVRRIVDIIEKSAV